MWTGARRRLARPAPPGRKKDTMADSSPGRVLACALLSLTAASCAGMGKNTPPLEAQSVPGPDESMDPIAAAAFWGTRFDRTPDDPDVAAAFSRALRTIGNNAEALNVTLRATRQNTDHPALLLEHGKTLIANKRPHEALRPIEDAISHGMGDSAGAHSAHGVALDMTGDHVGARAAYARAMDIAPGDPSTLNNLALSYALSGRLQDAKNTLRGAVATEESTALMRQNYAMVLALSGDADEAERLARSDLPPPVAANNAAYFRSLVGRSAYWADLENADVDLPDFGDDPETVSQAPRGTPVAEPVPSPTPHLIGRSAPQRPSRPAPAPAPKPERKVPPAAAAPQAKASPDVEGGPVIGEAAPDVLASIALPAAQSPARTADGDEPKILFFSND